MPAIDPRIGVLRTCTAPGLKPCKSCKAPFAVGDQWVSRTDGKARLCMTCAAEMIAALLAEAEESRHARAMENLEHRRAVTEAKRLGLVL